MLVLLVGARVDPMTGPSDGADFSGLRAMFINCTLKRSPELSHTEGLVDASAAIMLKHGVDGRGGAARSTTTSPPASIRT